LKKIENTELRDFLHSKKYLVTACDLADRMGVKLYIVGGYVRDFLLNRQKNEIDFLVTGSGVDYASAFAAELGVNKVSVYRNFGTAQFPYNGMNFEFVGARRESYNRNSRKPIVEEGSFEDDISRRDFTINTLAASLNREDFGMIIDVYNGMEDLDKNLIRTPLEPGITFDDDPLRMMRAARFASQLDFYIDESVLKASGMYAERLRIVSQERITDEFLKILESSKPSIGLNILYNTGIMRVIFPEVANLGGVDQRKDYHHKDVFVHTCMVVDNVAAASDNLWLRFAALMHDIAKPVTKKFVEGIGWTFHGHEEIGARMMDPIFHKLKLPLHKLEYVTRLVRLHLRPISLVDEGVTDSAIRRLIVSAGEDLEDLITLCRADITSKNPQKVSKYLANYDLVMEKVREVQEKDKLREFQSPVRGEEIMAICNIPPSRKVGDIKKAIEEAILDGKIQNTYEDAYQYLLRIKDTYL